MTTTFCRVTSLPVRAILDGTVRGQYLHTATMTLGEVFIDADTLVPMHRHPHEQITYLIEGRFEFTVGEKTTVLEPGMAALIPGNVMHGGRTITACRVLDVFSPVREDYR